jgi:DNA-binding CsgD family transcriptional regulator
LTGSNSSLDNKIYRFWNALKPQIGLTLKEEETWKRKTEFLDKVSLDNNVVVFVWNAFTNRFIFMSDKLKVLSGLDPSLYLQENGMQYSFSRMHPDQIEGIMSFQKTIAHFFTQETAKPDYANGAVICNYLYKNGDNDYVPVLQRTIRLEADENHNPVLFLSFIHYVGHIKKYDALNCVLSSADNVRMYTYNAPGKCMEGPKMFSTHEKNIISLLAQGFDTKTIAQKLFISPNTVNTHRRNLIKKTDCLDTTGVVVFAKLINLI